MRILVSNDDGYQAEGIKQLTQTLSEIAEVVVVAPNENKSAASSSLTIGKPLEPIQIDENVLLLMPHRVIVSTLHYAVFLKSQLIL